MSPSHTNVQEHSFLKKESQIDQHKTSNYLKADFLQNLYGDANQIYTQKFSIDDSDAEIYKKYLIDDVQDY